MNMEKYMIDFIEEYRTEINEKQLREPLLLHMICLYDYEQIDRKLFSTIIEMIDKKTK